jgi:uncharacterized repeat protein (TIGR03803 family)
MTLQIIRSCTLRIATAVSISAVLAPLGGCGGVPVTTGSTSEGSMPNATSHQHTLPDPRRWRETSLHSFNYADGAYNLYSGLLFDAAGNLFGTTQSGGNSGCNLDESCGVAFKLMPAANGKWTEKVLHRFFARDPLGFWPRAGLIIDAKGNLYGTTDSGGPFCSGLGCGAVFELLPNNTAKVIYQFMGGNDGSSPDAALTFDPGGNLYGTTALGGAQNCGTIFELTSQPGGSWTERILHSFSSREGCESESKVAFDHAGSLYGTADFGGAYGSACGGYGCGTAFQLKPGASGIWTLTILHSFGKGNDGAYPVSGLAIDSAGNLFGVTSQGGKHSSACFAYGCGTVFELLRGKADTWTERVIHDFDSGTDGRVPRGDLIFDDRGALYGTAVFGGAYGAGNAFRLLPRAGDKWEEKLLHSFGNRKDGALPYSGMIFDQAHDLYGTTAGGGSYRAGMCRKSGGCGTIFEIKPRARPN